MLGLIKLVVFSRFRVFLRNRSANVNWSILSLSIILSKLNKLRRQNVNRTDKISWKPISIHIHRCSSSSPLSELLKHGALSVIVSRSHYQIITMRVRPRKKCSAIMTTINDFLPLEFSYINLNGCRISKKGPRKVLSINWIICRKKHTRNALVIWKATSSDPVALKQESLSAKAITP